jgi:alkanesulfonate monooxygenase SsuD/methylene tetrahydromethanopterin reductase-like flavin-dependent oxidoreductase (luciferase family)
MINSTIVNSKYGQLALANNRKACGEEMFHIGVFDHLDRGHVELDKFYEDRFRVIEAFERSGFYAYHVAEHHFTPLGMAPSPSVYLAAVAQRTKRLRFGPLVYALPLYHPLRLIQEICMLDQISGGRLEIGFGRGASPIEAAYYDQRAAQEIYEEGLQLVLEGLRSRKLSFEGQIYHFKDIPLALEPFQKPHPPLWYGVHSVESAARAARQQLNVVSFELPDDARTVADSYRDAWREAHGDAPLGKNGLLRFVFVAQTDEKALDAARRAYLEWYKSFHYLFHLHGSMPRSGPRAPSFDEVMAQGRGTAGSPQTVAKFINEQMEKTGCNYFVGQFAFGDLSLSEMLESIELFRARVMPELGVDAITDIVGSIGRPA